MKLKTLLASMVAVCMLTACEDLFEDGSLQPDGSNPSLSINNPGKNQTVSASTGLRINITAVDKDQFKDISFTLEGQKTEKAVLSFSKHPDRNVVEFDTTLSVNGIAPGAYTLVVSATDKRTNLTVQEVHVNVE